MNWDGHYGPIVIWFTAGALTAIGGMVLALWGRKR